MSGTMAPISSSACRRSRCSCSFRVATIRVATRRIKPANIERTSTGSIWSLVAPACWSLVARLAVIPWSLVAHSNS
jgi:hypothetical protein